MILHECLRQWLHRYGEPFQAEEQTHYGLFFQPPGELLRWHFSPEALAELPRPLWALVITPEVALESDSALWWRDRLYRVLRVLEFRVGTTPLYRLLLITPVS
ncbi:MAG: hypothetical protein RMK45_04660 [Armatimonadota bacterium]|nr:hypothetical protein [Armatimonadota bacterium]